MEFQGCCSWNECGCYGMPIDVEYYLLQNILKSMRTASEIKG